MKREKENQIMLAKEKDMDGQFKFRIENEGNHYRGRGFANVMFE